MSGLVIDDVSMTFELPDGGKVEALKNINLNIKANCFQYWDHQVVAKQPF